MNYIELKTRTALPLTDAGFTLSPDERMLLVGSCFTDSVGARLQNAGADVCINPGGVQYNPASIAGLLRAAMRGALPEHGVFEHEGRVRSWLLPTRFSAAGAEEAAGIFADTLQRVREALLRSRTFVFTWGTAWIYTHLPNVASAFADVVSNCHKVPAPCFTRRRLDVQEIVADWKLLVQEIHDFRQAAGVVEAVRLIFTVSPIRHFKDGAHENTLSKATLHLAQAELCAYLPQTHYFPAWELLMDDLRDYRYYATDMVHPSEQAVDYIWDYFRQTYFSAADRERMAAAERAARRNCHRQLLD